MVGLIKGQTDRGMDGLVRLAGGWMDGWMDTHIYVKKLRSDMRAALFVSHGNSN